MPYQSQTASKRAAEAGSRDEDLLTNRTVAAPSIGTLDSRRWQPWGRRGQSLMRTLQSDHLRPPGAPLTPPPPNF